MYLSIHLSISLTPLPSLILSIQPCFFSVILCMFMYPSVLVFLCFLSSSVSFSDLVSVPWVSICPSLTPCFSVFHFFSFLHSFNLSIHIIIYLSPIYTSIPVFVFISPFIHLPTQCFPYLHMLFWICYILSIFLSFSPCLCLSLFFFLSMLPPLSLHSKLLLIQVF